MTLPELALKLKALGYPLAYSHFKEKTSLPFICYLVLGDDNFEADNITYHEILNVDIELYTTTKNLAAENSIKTMLKNNELPYSYDEVYVEDEGVFKCTFSIQI